MIQNGQLCLNISSNCLATLHMRSVETFKLSADELVLTLMSVRKAVVKNRKRKNRYLCERWTSSEINPDNMK